MANEIQHARAFFALFGLLLGALYGLVFSVWMPTKTAIIMNMYSPAMWTISILSFFILQFGLGVLLKKPNVSREIYFGLFLIPVTYTTSSLTIAIPQFFQTLIAVEVPALVLFVASFYFFSPFISFFVGFDTKALEDRKIPSETTFGFDIQHSTEVRKGTSKKKEDLKFLARIVRGLGFTILNKDLKESNGLIICQKEKLYMGIFYEFKIQGVTSTFIPFKIENDAANKVEELDEILDLKAQITGMLYSWLQTKLILMFNEIPPNLEVGLNMLSDGLGPLRKPLIPHLKETIAAFPKHHPYRFALLTSGLVIIINVTLFILGRLVFK